MINSNLPPPPPPDPDLLKTLDNIAWWNHKYRGFRMLLAFPFFLLSLVCFCIIQLIVEKRDMDSFELKI